MFCKNCGAETNENAAVCLKCGANANTGNSFCKNCGAAVSQNAAVCLHCGSAISNQNIAKGSKSKMAAGLLAIFLGYLGVHNFYLGYTKKAVIQLLVSLLGAFLFGLGPLAMSIWAIVEAVNIFQGKITDADGNTLSE